VLNRRRGVRRGAVRRNAKLTALRELVRNRGKPEVTTSAAEAGADDVTPAAEMRDGQGRTSADAGADVSGPVRTS
jgi:hypothetical protein